MLTGVYTVDDSADLTPTSANLYSTDVETLREQVASLEETHAFSPTLLNTARVGFSRGGIFLHRRTDAGNSRRRSQRICGGQARRHGGGGRKRRRESRRRR